MSDTAFPCPLLSIVIATRNRMPYAISAIVSILEILDPRLELVIQDNSDTRDLGEWIRCNIQDTRLRYHFTDNPLSIVGNFDAAANLASGTYVCFIGDDDGINPEIMEAAEWALRTEVDALAVRTVVHYLWPDTGDRSTFFTKASGGSLQIEAFSGYLKRSNVEDELRSLMHRGGLYYLDSHLPKLYHGIVNRHCLVAIREKTGVCIGGLSPDTFSAMAIACVAGKVVVTDYPLTIPGACRVSGSVQEGDRRNSKRLKDAPHLRNRGEYHWNKLVPRVYSVETIWVDSSIAALRAMDRHDLVKQLNLPRLAAHCIAANRGVAARVLRGMLLGLRTTGGNRAFGLMLFISHLVAGSGARFFWRFWNRLLLMIGVKTIFRLEGLDSMIEATHAMTDHLRKTGRSFAESRRRWIV